jgi:hypothetical protein
MTIELLELVTIEGHMWTADFQWKVTIEGHLCTTVYPLQSLLSVYVFSWDNITVNLSSVQLIGRLGDSSHLQIQ